jgi:YggT family protein
MIENNLQQNQDLNLREKERSIAAANQNSAIARIIHIVYFLFGILELLLALRVLLRLFGANPANGFANFIYTRSGPFVALFASLLGNPALSTASVLEITTIVAMIVYGILAWLITRLIWLVLSRPR